MGKVLNFKTGNSLEKDMKINFGSDKYILGVITKDKNGKSNFNTCISPLIDNDEISFLITILNKRLMESTD